VLDRLLAHPLTRGLDLDDPRTTAARRRIVREKPFLRAIYDDWYARLLRALPPAPGRVLELGAGGGFLDEKLPEAIRSEVFLVPGVDAVLDALALPVASGALRAIVMTNVLHHLPSASTFLAEAARCVRSGGVVGMIEPWNTPWSRLVYRRFHHEPFAPEATSWEAAGRGPLSRANGALPWILFARDRAALEREHPEWSVARVAPFMPFRYLVSGGVSRRSLMPAMATPLWRALERALDPLRDRLALFAEIVLERR